MENNKDVKKFFNRRNLKYGSNSIIMIVAVIVIAILVNILVGMTDLKLDLTPNKLYSLSDATKTELKNLKQEVEIIGLFDEEVLGGSDYKEAVELLNLYAKNPNIKVRYVDPDRNVGIIKELDPDGAMDLTSNDFVVRSKVNGVEKKKKFGYYDLFEMQQDQYSYQTQVTGSNAEQCFTGAIKYVTSEKTPVVYFTEGHSEIDVDSEYQTVKGYLEKNNYLVKGINLMTADKVPEDAALVVVASPKQDLNVSERDKLEEYAKNSGGNLIFMFDYLESDPDFDQFNSLLGEFNVAVNYDKVKENNEQRHVPSDPYTILLDVKSNSIIPSEFNTVLANSRSISILKNTKDYITTTSLMSTSDEATGEMVSKARGNDLKGPLDIAVAVEYKGGAKPSKVLVMGNASFIADSAAENYANYYQNSIIFFLQSMGWMIASEDEIIVPTKNYEVNQINITQLQSNIVGGVLVVVFPLIILGAGLMVYLRRRHL